MYQLCPDGPSNPPVDGMIDGDNWVGVDDDVERWVQIGPLYGDRTTSTCYIDGPSNPPASRWHN